jgi:hypothetical protein
MSSSASSGNYRNSPSETAKAQAQAQAQAPPPPVPSDAAASSFLPAPRGLELSVDPQDGSLRTVPLLHAVLASTNDLYEDLYQMAMGQIDVATTTTASASASQHDPTGNLDLGGGSSSNNSSALHTSAATKLERMVSLSFAQRRHELSRRLHRHARGIQHVSALTAAQAAAIASANSSSLGSVARICSDALMVARSSWTSADEAQDALYFFHANLFPQRASPHDLFGSLDVLLEGSWYDLPRDLKLSSSDPYQDSEEALWSKQQVDELWQLSVRTKLATGEVGWTAQQLQRRQLQQRQQHMLNQSTRRTTTSQKSPLSASTSLTSSWWNLSLRGGVLTLTHRGITALVTVLSSPKQHQQDPTDVAATMPPAANPWTLLSVEVEVKAKTGELQHQLRTNRRQRHDLHRLCAHAMNLEEARFYKRVTRVRASKGPPGRDVDVAAKEPLHNESDGDDDEPDDDETGASKVSRPLNALFQVSWTFLLSWQLELLSAQAQSLRRGAWNSTGVITSTPATVADSLSPGIITNGPSSSFSGGQEIHVTPVQFFDHDHGHRAVGDRRTLGVLSVSFWRVDDAYGPPCVGELVQQQLPDDDDPSADAEADTKIRCRRKRAERTSSRTHQLELAVRAVAGKGIVASLSGFVPRAEVSGEENGPKSSSDDALVREVMLAVGDPLALSMSDALLAATRWCASQRCLAAARALRRSTLLPSWIDLNVEGGCIAVAARVRYHGAHSGDDTSSCTREFPVLFRLACDARSGSFVPCFPRECALLRGLAGNTWNASEPVALHIASLPPNRRRASGAASSGRVVRDAFEGLVRSMNVLGQKVGVGGSWDDLDDKSSLLRERSVQAACVDAKVSLVKACSMASLYGLAALATGCALGVDAAPDM